MILEPDPVSLLGHQLRRVLGTNMPVAPPPMEMASPLQGQRLSADMPQREANPQAVSQILSAAQQAGFKGDALRTAAAIALAESGGNATAHNPNARTGDNSYGLWQINMLGDMGPARLKQYGLASNDALYDPATNARVAYEMSGGGQRFGDWTTYNTGKHQSYLGAVDAALGARQPVVTDAPGTRALGEQVSSLHNTAQALRGKAAPLQAVSDLDTRNAARTQSVIDSAVRALGVMPSELAGPSMASGDVSGLAGGKTKGGASKKKKKPAPKPAARSYVGPVNRSVDMYGGVL